MFFTSYFGNLRNINTENFKLVSIAVFQPFEDPKIHKDEMLVPSQNTFMLFKKGGITEKEYTEHYVKQLETFWPFLEPRLKSAKESETDVVFLCYEKDGFCHRHILAKFLTDRGYDCEELTGDNNGRDA